MPKTTKAATAAAAAARRQHPAEPTQPLPLRLSESLIARIEEFREQEGFSDRSAAMRYLITRGLSCHCDQKSHAEQRAPRTDDQLRPAEQAAATMWTEKAR